MPDSYLVRDPARFWADEYACLLESLPDAVYAYDLEGNLTSTNAAGERLSGFRRGDLLGMSMRQLLSVESYASVMAIVQDAIAGKEPCSSQADFLTCGGSVVPIEIHIAVRREQG